MFLMQKFPHYRNANVELFTFQDFVA